MLTLVVMLVTVSHVLYWCAIATIPSLLEFNRPDTAGGYIRAGAEKMPLTGRVVLLVA
jgi:hypothetical protein